MWWNAYIRLTTCHCGMHLTHPVSLCLGTGPCSSMQTTQIDAYDSFKDNVQPQLMLRVIQCAACQARSMPSSQLFKAKAKSCLLSRVTDGDSAIVNANM